LAHGLLASQVTQDKPPPEKWSETVAGSVNATSCCWQAAVLLSALNDVHDEFASTTVISVVLLASHIHGSVVSTG
jgi:hypothetical protein